MPAHMENSAVATGLEKVSFHSNPKERLPGSSPSRIEGNSQDERRRRERHRSYNGLERDDTGLIMDWDLVVQGQK